MVCFVGLNAQATTPSDYRLAIAGSQFDEVRQFAMAFEIQSPKLFGARHLELAVGAVSSLRNDRPFVSLGPVWRLPVGVRSAFVELGFSPTIIGGSTFDGRDLGGNVHFTSSVAIGTAWGARETFAIALRVQHTSNGGLGSRNPGIDMIGLSVAFDFDRQ